MTASTTTLDLTATGRAIVILASLALGAAWTTGSEPARVAACLLLAPLLVDWAAKIRRFDGLEIRVGRRRTRAGAALVDRVVLANGRRRTIWNLHVGAHGLLASTRANPARVECLPGGGTLDLDLPLRARSRGRASVRPFGVWTQHPLGLVRLHTKLQVSATVIAEPARIALTVATHATGNDGDRAAESMQRRDGEAYYALRELRDGDDWARVHALRSAALGQPVRVVRRGTIARAARVLLDLRSPPRRAPDRYAGQTFEWGLSAAATLIEDLTRGGRTVDVVVLGKKRSSFIDLGGRLAPTAFFEFLASARPQLHVPTPESTLSWLAAGEGDVYWIVAGGFAATFERDRAGRRVQVLEWVA